MQQNTMGDTMKLPKQHKIRIYRKTVSESNWNKKTRTTKRRKQQTYIYLFLIRLMSVTLETRVQRFKNCNIYLWYFCIYKIAYTLYMYFRGKGGFQTKGVKGYHLIFFSKFCTKLTMLFQQKGMNPTPQVPS